MAAVQRSAVVDDCRGTLEKIGCDRNNGRSTRGLRAGDHAQSVSPIDRLANALRPVARYERGRFSPGRLRTRTKWTVGSDGRGTTTPSHSSASAMPSCITMPRQSVIVKLRSPPRRMKCRKGRSFNSLELCRLNSTIRRQKSTSSKRPRYSKLSTTTSALLTLLGAKRWPRRRFRRTLLRSFLASGRHRRVESGADCGADRSCGGEGVRRRGRRGTGAGSRADGDALPRALAGTSR